MNKDIEWIITIPEVSQFRRSKNQLIIFHVSFRYLWETFLTSLFSTLGNSIHCPLFCKARNLRHPWFLPPSQHVTKSCHFPFLNSISNNSFLLSDLHCLWLILVGNNGLLTCSASSSLIYLLRCHGVFWNRDSILLSPCLHISIWHMKPCTNRVLKDNLKKSGR